MLLLLVKSLWTLASLALVVLATILLCKDLHKFYALLGILGSFFRQDSDFARPAELLLVLIYVISLLFKVGVVYLLFRLMLWTWPL